MLQVAEALERLLSHFAPGQIEIVGLSSAAGRVLAEVVNAEFDSPPFTQSAMDGVAVRSEDLRGMAETGSFALQVIGKAAAGDIEGLQVEAGQAALIMTGAPLPDGADTVVRVEDTNLDFSSNRVAEEVIVFANVNQGENIRLQGENFQAGAPIFAAGHRLLPQDVGMLAMLGKGEVAVFKRPVIGIFATGDELEEPGRPLGFGKIWNSNSYMLKAMVERFGGEVVDLGIVPDSMQEVRAALEAMFVKPVDLILTSGGVSMGLHDYLRRVVSENGEINFWKVNMRPGKPLAFGHFRGVPFIGLPGNPVSSFVGCLLFVGPAIEKMSGQPNKALETVAARIRDDMVLDGRESYLPGRYQKGSHGLIVEPVGNQSSGNLYALVQGNCLIKIAPGVQSLKQDSIVDIWKFA